MRRGRFAPTPSGELHIGNARTALLAWLQMRSCGGAFVLRMEDIDLQRSKPAYAAQILDDLRWLGLDWDEGPDAGGPYAPYTQSERLDRYEEALAHLEAAGHLYPCFCSRAKLLAVAGAPHGLASEGPAYAGTCRGLTAAERSERAARKSPSLRFAIPLDAEGGPASVRYTDLAAGEMTFPCGAGGDFVVKRADGMYSYQLAVVVDDAAMGITDVLRGRDLLDSTPRQLLLYGALGLQAPSFAHVPLLVGPDGRRLAKRRPMQALADLRRAGVRPEAVVGLLAYWSGLLDRPEPATPAELASSGFDLTRIPQTPVVVGDRALASLANGLTPH